MPTRRIDIDGVPPKKDGANSMWGSSTERGRIKALRRAAAERFSSCGPASGSVRMTLRVYADPGAGDLDNFITGVCDALMPAHAAAGLRAEDWSDLPPEARPDRAIAFADDRCVSRIVAERLDPAGRPPRYELELIWEPA